MNILKSWPSSLEETKIGVNDAFAVECRACICKSFIITHTATKWRKWFLFGNVNYRMSCVRPYCLYLLTSRISQMPWVFQKSLTNLACTHFANVAGIKKNNHNKDTASFQLIYWGNLLNLLLMINGISKFNWAGISRQLVPPLVKDFMRVLIGSLAMSLPRQDISLASYLNFVAHLFC